MHPQKTIFSGIRPTGTIHIGNYFGAIHQWVLMQNQSSFEEANLFCIVDLHALTTLSDADHLGDHCRIAAAAYLASGIDPKKSAVFIQSHVPAHSELAWILGCVTPLGWLNRMTQFKDKAGKNKDQALLGLFAYPVLMAADILAYQTTHVPVGEDQKQHVEIARDIAGAFNHRFGETFILPEPIIQEDGARIMSLRDGTKKMSKSDISEYSRIDLMDSPDLIMQKIKKAKTDLFPIPETEEELKNRPEAMNLVEIYALCLNKPIGEVLKEFSGQNFAPFKQSLADVLISRLTPIRNEMDRLLKDHGYLDRILDAGQDVANKMANDTLRNVKRTLKLI